MSIDELRQEIDIVDDFIAASLKKRLEITKQIMKEKKKQGLANTDKIREEAIIDRLSRNTGLKKAYLKDIYAVIFKESKGDGND